MWSSCWRASTPRRCSRVAGCSSRVPGGSQGGSGASASSSHSRRTVSQAVMWIWPTPRHRRCASRRSPWCCSAAAWAGPVPQSADGESVTCVRCSSATQASVASLSLTVIIGSSAAGQAQRPSIHRQTHAHGHHQLEQRGRVGRHEAQRTAAGQRHPVQPRPVAARLPGDGVAGCVALVGVEADVAQRLPASGPISATTPEGCSRENSTFAQRGARPRANCTTARSMLGIRTIG
jgi:hypothetical protein